MLITATRYSDGVRIEMWGTKKYSKVTASFSGRYNYRGFTTVKDDGADCVASAGVQGFSISVTRRRYDGSKVGQLGDLPDRLQGHSPRDLHQSRGDVRVGTLRVDVGWAVRSAAGAAADGTARATLRSAHRRHRAVEIGDPMTYVIALPCVDLKDKACIDECPVDCIYEGERMLYIHPDECVDCGACEPVCPVEAIFYEDDVPGEWQDYTAGER